MGDAGGLIPSVSLEALLARRAAAVEALARIGRAVADYQALGAAIWGGGVPGDAGSYRFRGPVQQRPSGGGPHLDDERWLEHATASVDASLWEFLLDQSGLRSFLDQRARKEWDEQIEARKTPPLTEENVRATFSALHARRGEFFERGVVGVFRSLSWDYKTNRPCQFGTRIVVRHVMDGFGHPVRSDGLDDLLRALHVLDGKPEPDHRQGVTQRLWQRTRQEREGGADLVDDYLRIRTFKNGNGHVTLLRPDLVDQLNRILARHYPDALPAARPARRSGSGSLSVVAGY